MLTEEKNKILTQVGAGTPGGELLRHYWQPLAVAQEFTEENSTKFVRVLGEDLVLFVDKSGRPGLIDDRCPHRGASLTYGRVEERGIACAYHGWLMDCEGKVLETPAEKGDGITKSVTTKAYPVQKFFGFYWGYLGPLPAPVLPKFDIFMQTDGCYEITEYPRLDTNWFTAVENAVDSAHLLLLHQERPHETHKPKNTTRGYIDDVEKFEYYPVDYGIMKQRTYKNGEVDAHPMIFPLWLRVRGAVWLRTPIDDEHTNHWIVRFKSGKAPSNSNGDPDVVYLEPFKSPPNAIHPEAKYPFPPKHGWPLGEDVVMWETQGLIPDRSRENLGASDQGIALLRKMMFENIEKVQRGEEPMGVYRDPDEIISTGDLKKDFTHIPPSGIGTETVPFAPDYIPPTGI